MLDLGWSEMAIIATVALFVIGPKDLPKALRTAGRYGGKVKALAREFQSSIDEAVKEAEKDLHLDEVKKGVQSFKNLNMDTALNATEKLAAPKASVDSAVTNNNKEQLDVSDAENAVSAPASPTVTAAGHFAQVKQPAQSQILAEKGEEQVPEDGETGLEDAGAKEGKEAEAPTLPLPTGVKQVVEARKKVEAAAREEAESQEDQLSSAAQERRVEPQ